MNYARLCRFLEFGCKVLTDHDVFQKSSRGTPGKKRSPSASSEQQPPVVVIFKDLEAFNPRVLQDFILVCR